jgi:uncharacterized protein
MRWRLLSLAFGTAFAAGLALPAAAQFNPGATWVTVANAASVNKTDDVRMLLQQGKDPNEVDSLGKTALDYAAGFDNVEMAQVLLDHNAQTDARDSLNSTALHWAAERGKVDVMTLLIAHKATVDVQNRQGITPLMLAVEHNEMAAVRLLIQNGADPRKQDYTGRDAYGWGAGKNNILALLATAKH